MSDTAYTRSRNPDYKECRSCFGHGHFDHEGRITLDRRAPKCSHCAGTGWVKS